MAASLTLLNPLPKAAKFINYTDFDIVPITSTEPINLPLQNGDRMHVAPPSEMYLIDGNNNAYKNVLPPSDDFEGEPTVIQEYGQYKVYENIKDALIYPTTASGWRLDYFPPSPPTEPEPEKVEIKDNSNMILAVGLFILIIVISIVLALYNRKTRIERAYNESLPPLMRNYNL